jgi:hypothetical protein
MNVWLSGQPIFLLHVVLNRAQVALVFHLILSRFNCSLLSSIAPSLPIPALLEMIQARQPDTFSSSPYPHLYISTGWS